jgi:Tfp pilus assembly protein PilF
MTSRRALSYIVAGLLLIGFAADVAAQDWSGSGRVKGTVRDADGNPVAGAKVFYRMLEDREAGPPPFTTNKKGSYSFLGLKGGTWIVRVEADGFRPWTSPEPVEVYSTGVSEAVGVNLERVPAEELAAIARYNANENLKAGDALVAKGDFAGARAEYQKALATVQDGDKPVVLAAIGATFVNEGDIDAAKQTYEQSLALDPNHIESLKGMCNIVAYQGDMKLADELYARIPADEPIHPNVLITMAMGHFNQGDAETAKALLDRAIRDSPDNALSHYYRGLTELSLGDNDAARADLQKSLELDPNHAEAANAREFINQLGGEPGS